MANKVKDLVCGMEIRPEDAAATEEHEGHTFYFLQPGLPRYVRQRSSPSRPPGCGAR